MAGDRIGLLQTEQLYLVVEPDPAGLSKSFAEPILPVMEIRDALTTDAYRHQKGIIAARIQIIPHIHERMLEDVQRIQTPEIK